jgi:predicted transcriptional regulator
MRKEIKRLGDGELEIMQAIWAAGEPVNSAYIQTALAGKRDWALPTTLTVLSRLCDKGFLSSEKMGRSNLYTAGISEEAYRCSEGKTILEKLYAGSVTGLVASLYDGKSISDRDMAELRQLLDVWEEKR